MSNYVLDIVVQ